jgi:DNA-binding HxlR family transcriptional regulator
VPDPHRDDSCPMARTLGLFGDHWSMLIVREAFFGHDRYEQFRSRLGISDNTLSRRLAGLVEHGILQREPVVEGGRAHYTLTRAGNDLAPVLAAIGAWGARWLPRDRPDSPPPAAVAAYLSGDR